MRSFWRLVLVAFVAAFTLPVGYQLNQAAICDAWAHAATITQVIAAPHLFVAMTGHLLFLQDLATARVTASCYILRVSNSLCIHHKHSI